MINTETNPADSKTIAINSTQMITPFLWFDGKVEEAINFYISVFPNSEIVNTHRLPGNSPGEAGKILTGTFRLNGVEFMVLDGGPMFTFNESISFFVKCETQQEVDHLWNALATDGGQEGRCGWLKDKYGVSWQIVPNALGRLLGDPNPQKAQNVMQAMMRMGKIIIAELQAAHDK
ncbi:VOC family protein [Mucilaginibacter sp. X4EP1]|jgi:predicted 3-demethylubiquinone-9 3-methyltransferase (glyoxalase superfamily)|uniref:VOC family protein n=1 Tax=Mucilaginibacter sp. X4EP1 TaxID=2723092 RepID=UPI00216985F2|nr:VOC family protein [Mucilaginibacter sp. X4EP1]MCS3816096.1 putative 3-demethylubiquinone-9 3-methyltransferase (glyoxalase superfamily) [Mucilaginibacter sp. X4EP1]